MSEGGASPGLYYPPHFPYSQCYSCYHPLCCRSRAGPSHPDPAERNAEVAAAAAAVVVVVVVVVLAVAAAGIAVAAGGEESARIPSVAAEEPSSLVEPFVEMVVPFVA